MSRRNVWVAMLTVSDGDPGDNCVLSPTQAGRGSPRLAAVDDCQFSAADPRPGAAGVSGVEAKPRDAGANGRMGMLLHAFEQYESAEICYRRARILDPSRFQWAYYLGLTQVINGKSDAAATLGDTIRLDSEYLPARLKLAEVLLHLRRLAGSERMSQATSD